MSRLLDVHNFVGEKLQWQQQVLLDSELTPTTKVIGCWLMHDLNVAKRGAWRSQDEIARMLGIHRRTVRRCIAELVAGGHVRTTPSKGRGHAVLYEALRHEMSPFPGPDKAAEGRRQKGDISCTSDEERGAKSAAQRAEIAPPYLEESIIPPFPPAAGQEAAKPISANLSAAEPSQVSFAEGLGPVPPDLRAKVVADPSLGLGWAKSWLDFCAFNPVTRELHPRSPLARDRIRQSLGPRRLKEWGLQLADPIGERAAIRAGVVPATGVAR